MSAAPRNRAKAESGIPVAEWICAAIGFTVVSVTLAFLAYRAFAGGDSPPDISIRVESIAQLREGYVLMIAATNRGDRTAANVKVEASLKAPAGVVETSEMSFTYLPPRSERRGGLFLRRDPRKFELSVNAKGYENP